MSAEKRISFKSYLAATDVRNVQIIIKNVKKHNKSKNAKNTKNATCANN